MSFPYTISQSLIKSFLDKGNERIICPKNIYYTKIAPEEEMPPTRPMMDGSYFETLTLGSGRGGKQTLDLPRKKLTIKQERENRVREERGQEPLLGQKSIAQIRIEEQAERFKLLCAQYQIVITEYNTQVPILKKWEKNEEIMLSGELDIFPTPVLGKHGLQMAIIDLKLTGKINNDFGDYCWGSPEHMDHIQAQMYHYLIRNIDFSLNEELKCLVTQSVMNIISNNSVLFLYWVFSYGSGILRDKFVRYDMDHLKLAEMHESINKTVAAIEKHEKEGWPADPEYERCAGCPLTNCAERCDIQAL